MKERAILMLIYNMFLSFTSWFFFEFSKAPGFLKLDEMVLRRLLSFSTKELRLTAIFLL